MPSLEFLELAAIGAELKDTGLVHLLKTTPFIRKLDLEDATDITDAVISAITPSSIPDVRVSRPPEAEPGHALEHLVISYAIHVSNEALLALVRGCPRLNVLEADNTHMSGAVLREFVRLACKRRAVNAKIVAVDCRGMGDTLVKDLSVNTRPRLGWRSYKAKRLKYLDGRDGDDLKVGQDECDEQRVVLKTFYSWQTVDAVRAAREKRRKSVTRRVVNDSIGGVSDDEEASGSTSRSGRARWWSPVGSGRRRMSGGNSPVGNDVNTNDGCRIM
jgi:F-box/leucine-rich repeat protein 2/20